MSSERWTVTDSTPQLGPEEIHVWQAMLNLESTCRQRLEPILAPAERRRAARYRFDRDRNWYVARRGLLRTLLGRYLEVPAEEVELRELDHGKPVLAGALAESDVHFNLSHSSGVALYAFTRGAEVGIDVERIDPRRADPNVAGRFFAPGEIRALRALTDGDWIRGFFECWTRKEAFVKAVGQGLSYPLDAFEVSVTPGAPARLLSLRDTAEPAAQWSMTALEVTEDFCGAVVVKGPERAVRCWRLA